MLANIPALNFLIFLESLQLFSLLHLDWLIFRTVRQLLTGGCDSEREEWFCELKDGKELELSLFTPSNKRRQLYYGMCLLISLYWLQLGQYWGFQFCHFTAEQGPAQVLMRGIWRKPGPQPAGRVSIYSFHRRSFRVLWGGKQVKTETGHLFLIGKPGDEGVDSTNQLKMSNSLSFLNI